MKHFWGVIMLFTVGMARAQEAQNTLQPLFFTDEYDDIGIFGDEILGVPGVDYPTLWEVPITTFSCSAQPFPGYYADPEAYCQVFYICQEGGKTDAFLCPNGTIFNQEFLVCDWWYNFQCGNAISFYGVNAEISRVMGEIDSATAARLTGGIPPSAIAASRAPVIAGVRGPAAAAFPGRFGAAGGPAGPLGLRGFSAGRFGATSGPFGVRGPAGAPLTNRFGSAASPFGVRGPAAVASLPRGPAGARLPGQLAIRGPAPSPFVGISPTALLARQRALIPSRGRYTSPPATLRGGVPSSGGPRPAIGVAGAPLRPFNAVGRPVTPFNIARRPYAGYTSPLAQGRKPGPGGPSATTFNQPSRFGSLPGVYNYNYPGYRGPSPIRGPSGAAFSGRPAYTGGYRGSPGTTGPSVRPTNLSTGSNVPNSGSTSQDVGYYYNRPSTGNRFPSAGSSSPGNSFQQGGNIPTPTQGNISPQSGNGYKPTASAGYNYNPSIASNNDISPAERPQSGRPVSYRPVSSRPTGSGPSSLGESDAFNPPTNNIGGPISSSTPTGQPVSQSPQGGGYNYETPSRPFPPPEGITSPSKSGTYNEPYGGGTPNREYLPPTK